MEWMPMHGLIHDDGWFCFSVFALLPTLLFRFSSLFFQQKPSLTLCIHTIPYVYFRNHLHTTRTRTRTTTQRRKVQKNNRQQSKFLHRRKGKDGNKRFYIHIYKQTITCNYYYLPIYTESFCDTLSIYPRAYIDVPTLSLNYK